MMVFTSAKSRLMIPGMVMMSEIPCTPWRRISSAMRNDSKKPASLRNGSKLLVRNHDHGIDGSDQLLCPRSACIMRRLPSKAKGR